MLSFVRRKELNRNRFKCRQSTWGREGGKRGGGEKDGGREGRREEGKEGGGKGKRKEGGKGGKGGKEGREGGKGGREGRKGGRGRGEGKKKEERERRNKNAFIFTVFHSLQITNDHKTIEQYNHTCMYLRAEATYNPRAISEILNIHKLLAF